MCLQSLTKTDSPSPLKKAISAAPLKWALKFYEATSKQAIPRIGDEVYCLGMGDTQGGPVWA